ncbi:hypothetical protein ACQ4PT_056993 [Festuca glaucescens]
MEDLAAIAASMDSSKTDAAAAAASDASASSSKGKDANLDDMFSHLELNEDELDDVVIGVDDAREYQQAARWLAIGKVHTSRSFSAEALFEKMKAVWNLSRDPIFREAGENLFIFQMHCLGDWKKIHGIPELYRKQEVADDLARRVGKVKEVQMSPKLFYEGNYVRIRVKLDITRPLMRFVSLTLPEGRRRLAVKYEKIPFFCKRCGLLGHDHEECGDGVWTEAQLQYGTWMLAVRRANQPAPAPRKFIPRAPMRGGFSGKGTTHSSGPKKRSSGDAELDDKETLLDMATNLEKKGVPSGTENMENEKNPDAKKQLDMNLGANGDGGSMEPGAGLGGNLTPPPPHPYVKTKDKAKARKTVSSEKVNESLATSAASLEDDRRAQ